MSVEELIHAVAQAAYQYGEAAGHARSEAEARRAFGELARKVRTATTRRDLDEWAAADAAGEPCGLRCGACSMCIRHAAVTRRGGRDYTGGPVDWEGGA